MKSAKGCHRAGGCDDDVQRRIPPAPAAGLFTSRSACHLSRSEKPRGYPGSTIPERILLCDRGTIDGAAYWPGDSNLFFEEQDSSLDQELSRYDGVIFFESAAVGGLDIEGGNPARLESIQQAADSIKNSSSFGPSTRTSSRCTTTKASFRKSPSASPCWRRWSPT